MKDIEVQDLLKKEKNRQNNFVELIASENFVSNDVLNASGSVFTNKYAEGYPGKRYYGGCEVIDEAETLAIERAKKLFNVNYVNVQPHSGSQANQAVYMALLNPGDKILGMSLTSGGHLTHGYHLSSSGYYYKSVSYDVNKETNELDYDEIRKIAIKEKPKLIICGASAYSREIDFKKFKEIAEECNALLMADVAHIAGLIITKNHQSPVEFADVITMTTHKTLRGPRGGMIITNNKEIYEKINKAVFPGIQGGPLMNTILAKAVAFGEALTNEYKEYIDNVVNNSKIMAKTFINLNANIITDGTDNHLFLLDTKKSYSLTGVEAEDILYKINIIVNKNTLPFDNERPMITSGIRIGTAAMTTHGFDRNKFIELTRIIDNLLKNPSNQNIEINRKKVMKLLEV